MYVAKKTEITPLCSTACCSNITGAGSPYCIPCFDDMFNNGVTYCNNYYVNGTYYYYFAFLFDPFECSPYLSTYANGTKYYPVTACSGRDRI
ncbi:unnamed protein product [Adineta steineri]|uniref:Uncharacterized protein n=1 Tax=Adineta steineri TaxID=433720 RepID=A0A814CGH5_9BILA|nr:unnamed protein product [Adineta steineri]CAF3604908.1 unnamed protein product [Adineta steineri]